MKRRPHPSPDAVAPDFGARFRERRPTPSGRGEVQRCLGCRKWVIAVPEDYPPDDLCRTCASNAGAPVYSPAHSLSPEPGKDVGADGPASLARPSAVRAVQPEAGHATVQVREYRDALVIDRLLQRGWLSEAEHAAAEQVCRVGRAAGVGPGRTVGMLGGAHGPGQASERQRETWLALMQAMPVDCQTVVHATCVADQWPMTPQWLATLKRGLGAIAKEARRAPRQPIRAAWAD